MKSEPILTREQVRRADSIAINDLKIPGVVLMENAGRGAAGHIRREMDARGARRAVVFCGGGNNGGDGFVVVRHLLNAGVEVLAYLAGDPERLSGDCAANYQIATAMGADIRRIDGPGAAARATAELRPGDAVIDALLGTGFSGNVRAPLDVVIDGINAADKTLVVAIDVPSGLDCNSGEPANAATRADLTVTFLANKIGFTRPGAGPYVGRVVVQEIGAPPALVERLLAE